MMKKKCFFMLLAILSSVLLVAQNSKEELRDSTYINNVLEKVSNFLMESDQDSAFELINEADSLSVKINYLSGKFHSRLKLGVLEYYKGDHLKSISYYKKAQLVAIAMKDSTNIGRSLHNIGLSYYFLGEYHQTMKIYLEASNYLMKSNYLTVVNYLGLGEVHNIFKQHEKALTHLVMALEQWNDKIRMDLKAEILIELGRTYLMINKTEVAYKSFKEAEKLFELFDSPFTQASLYENLSKYYLYEGNISMAQDYALRAYKLTADNTFVTIKPRILQVLGDIYAARGNYDRSKKYYIESLDLLKKTTDKEIEAKTYLSLMRLSEKSNNSDDASYYADRYIRLNDSLTSEENVRIISNLAEVYEAEKKDKIIAQNALQLQKKENQLLKKNKQNNRFVIVISILLAGLIFIIAVYKQLQKVKEKEIKELRQKIKLSRLLAVMEGEEKERNRIAEDLHDGINGDLTAFKFQIAKIYEEDLHSEKNLQKLLTTVDDTIEEVRSISRNLAPPMFLSENFSAVIRNYCDSLSVGRKLRINFLEYGKIKKLKRPNNIILYRVVQELLTNIVKHSKASEVLLQINYHDTYLILQVEDNGIGFNVEKIKTGLGINNIKSRLALLETSYNLESSSKGTLVTIKLYYDKLMDVKTEEFA